MNALSPLVVLEVYRKIYSTFLGLTEDLDTNLALEQAAQSLF